MKCIKCDQNLDDGVKFCKFCGQNQTEEVVKTETVQTETTAEDKTPAVDLNKIKEKVVSSIDVDKIKEQASSVANKISEIDVSKIKEQASGVANKISEIDVGEIKNNTEEKIKSGDKKTIAICGVAVGAVLILLCLIVSSLFSGSADGILYLTEDYDFMYISDYSDADDPTLVFEMDSTDRRNQIITDNNIMYVFITETKNSNYLTTIFSYDLNSKKIEETEIDDFRSDSSYMSLYKATNDNFYYLVDGELYYYNTKTKQIVEVISDVNNVLVDEDGVPAFVTEYKSSKRTYILHKIDVDKTIEVESDLLEVFIGRYNTDLSNSSLSHIYMRKYGEMLQYDIKKGSVSTMYNIEFNFDPDSDEYDDYYDDFEWEVNKPYSHSVSVISPDLYYVSYRIDLTLNNFVDSNVKSFSNSVIIDALENLDSQDYAISQYFYDIYYNGEKVAEKAIDIEIDSTANLVFFNEFNGYNQYYLPDIINDDSYYYRYSNVLSEIYYYVYYEGVADSGYENIAVVGKNIDKANFSEQLDEMNISEKNDVYIDDVFLADDGNVYISVDDYDEDEYLIYKLEISKNKIQTPTLIFQDDDSVYLNSVICNPYGKDVYFMLRESGMNTLYTLVNNKLVEIEDDVTSIYFYESGDIYLKTDYDYSSETFRLYKLNSGETESIARNISTFTVLEDSSILYLGELSYTSRLRGSELTRYYKGNAEELVDEVIGFIALDADKDFVVK